MLHQALRELPGKCEIPAVVNEVLVFPATFCIVQNPQRRMHPAHAGCQGMQLFFLKVLVSLALLIMIY